MGIFPRFNGVSYDLFAANKTPCVMAPFSIARVPLDISIDFPEGTYGRLTPADDSTLLRVMNNKFESELCVMNGVFNHEIRAGDKIASFTVESVVNMEIKDISGS